MQHARCTVKVGGKPLCQEHIVTSLAKQFSDSLKLMRILLKSIFSIAFLLFTCCFQEDCNLPRAESISRNNCARSFNSKRNFTI